MKLGYLVLFLLIFSSPYVLPAYADTSAADRTITPKCETTEPEKRPCTFGQRQGYVDIRSVGEDANFLEFAPAEGVGNYADQDGKPAYRNKGLGDDGLVFTTEQGVIRVYWSDRPLQQA